jgi:hypothetical protein
MVERPRRPRALVNCDEVMLRWLKSRVSKQPPAPKPTVQAAPYDDTLRDSCLRRRVNIAGAGSVATSPHRSHS